MLQKQIEAERKAGKVILSSTTPPGGYYLPAAGDTMEIRKFIRTLENRGENTLRVLESARELLDAGQARHNAFVRHMQIERLV